MTGDSRPAARSAVPAATPPAALGEEASGGLVGVDRVLAVARCLAERPDGAGLDELARLMKYPKSTVHRGLAALRRAGFARQDETGRYFLGDDFLRLAFEYHDARPDYARVRPALDDLVQELRETVHYVVLDGPNIVYRAKLDPARTSVKLSSAVGGRNPAHATAAGKALLAQMLPDAEAVESWVAVNGPLVRRTGNTLTTAPQLAAELDETRARGFALDREENEPGVNCLAFAIWQTSPRQPSGALSVSALTYRFGVDELVSRAPEIKRIIIGALGDVVR